MSDDLTPKELNELSTKMNDAFLKEFGDDIFAGVPNNAASFHPTAANSEPITVEKLLKMRNDMDALFSNVPKQPPIEWSTGTWKGPLIELDQNDPFGHMEQLFSSGIHITSITPPEQTPPEQGWPIAMYCPICKVTTFVLSPYAIKPEKGDYWRMTKMCADSDKHNLEMSMPKIEFKPLDPYAYRPLPGGYVDATGPHRGVQPTQQDAMQIYMMHRHIFTPYDAEIVQEMAIEEAKRRWTNEPIPGEDKQ